MPDKEPMSVQDILAACRAADGGSAGSKSETDESERSVQENEQQSPTEQPSSTESAPQSPKPAAGAKKPGQMSVDEILASARSEKSGAKEAESAPAAAEKASETPPAAKKDPSKMSVAEMLAAARAEKPGAKAAAKPAAKPAAAKATPAAKPKAAATKPKAKPTPGPRDTASILAAARAAAKPGPISKAEAAARAEPKKAAKSKLQVPPRPERPAYVRPQPAPSAADSDRRGFFSAVMGAFVGSSLAIGFSTLALTNLLWGLGLARFMFPNILTEPPTRFKVGFPDQLAPGQVETKFKAQFGAWIVRDEFDGVPQIFALQSVCTHLGCTPNWLEGEQKFKCPCHGSGFYKDGVNFEGPAPRPLERFAIRLADDGQLEVDKSRRFKEEMGQWSDPASFVPV